MAQALPARPNLDWLRKTAKDLLRELRAQDPARKLADAQFSLARHAVGPHPFWGGRPQALHVSIETTRRDVFDLLLDAGADIDGDNRLYEHWSPLMITYDKQRPDMREVLLARGARIGVVEALMAGDDEAVRRMLQRGRAALPPGPNGGSILD